MRKSILEKRLQRLMAKKAKLTERCNASQDVNEVRRKNVNRPILLLRQMPSWSMVRSVVHSAPVQLLRKTVKRILRLPRNTAEHSCSISRPARSEVM